MWKCQGNVALCRRWRLATSQSNWEELIVFLFKRINVIEQRLNEDGFRGRKMGISNDLESLRCSDKCGQIKPVNFHQQLDFENDLFWG